MAVSSLSCIAALTIGSARSAAPNARRTAKPATAPAGTVPSGAGSSPFTLGGETEMLSPPHAPNDLAKVEATMSGSIHSPDAGGVFFHDPRFGKGQNDGRLYYTRYLGVAKSGKTLRFGFVRWRPLDAKQEMAQRFMPRPKHTIEDFETDGKRLMVHHYPDWPSKAKTLVEVYRWQGDPEGHGRFLLAATRTGPPAY
jgi:hypothetical protein